MLNYLRKHGIINVIIHSEFFYICDWLNTPVCKTKSYTYSSESERINGYSIRPSSKKMTAVKKLLGQVKRKRSPLFGLKLWTNEQKGLRTNNYHFV